jgi:hypothetical protein
MLGDFGKLIRSQTTALVFFEGSQGAVHHQIGVATDRAGEMGVVVFRQAIMPEGLRRIARAFQALQETNLQRWSFGFIANL